jgi:hypothetical protein
MANAAIFIGWGNPTRGREQKALQVFGESVTYWTQLQQDGAIESFETYLAEPHGGDLNGFAILKGDLPKLHEVRQREDFQRLVARAGLIVDNLGVINAATGDGLAAQMAMYGEQLGDLT